MIDVLCAEGWAVAGVARSRRDARGHHCGRSACPPRRRDRSGQRRGRPRAGVRASRRHRARGQRGLGVRWRSQRAVRRRADCRRVPDAFDSWAAAPARVGLLVPVGLRPVPAGARQARDAHPGDRRIVPPAAAGRGLWAAGAFGVRAITQAAALELRDEGIHVALLIVTRASSHSRTNARPASSPPRRPADLRPRDAVPRRSGSSRRHPRAPGHTAGRALGAVTAELREHPVPACTMPPSA